MKNEQQKQTRYLSQAIQLEEGASPAIIRMTMVVVSAAILSFIAWAAFTNINEVARTPGEVIPQGSQQAVQHLEGGIVRAILVADGERVEKNQILLRLDEADIQADIDRLSARQTALAMQEERLRAFVEGRTPDFSKYKKAYPDLVRDHERSFESMTDARKEQRTIIEEQIMQKKRGLSTLQAELKTARENKGITSDLYSRREALNKKGFASDVQLLETRKAMNDVSGDVAQLESRIAVTRSEISEFESRLSSLDADNKDEAHERLDAVLAEKAQNDETMEKLVMRLGRQTVRAPVTGFVNGIAVNTIGAVVLPGQTLMDIVPQDEKLVVQVKIPPQHIGHIKEGQSVQVKFSSFDFSRYGSVPGALEKVSATTFAGENGERFYRGQISLSRAYAGHETHNLIVPGMTATAEIVTGEKTILEYLLKPIHVAMKTAFSER